MLIIFISCLLQNIGCSPATVALTSVKTTARAAGKIAKAVSRAKSLERKISGARKLADNDFRDFLVEVSEFLGFKGMNY